MASVRGRHYICCSVRRKLNYEKLKVYQVPGEPQYVVFELERINAVWLGGFYLWVSDAGRKPETCVI